MTKQIFHTGIIPQTFSGLRVDQALAKLFPDYSRARITSWLKNNQITINEKILRPKDKIQGNEQIVINAELAEEVWEPENIALNIIYEDDALLVINKPAGLVVHPAHGNFEHTLVNALLHHCTGLSQLPRAGLIHRLDKETTGLLVIAKTLPAHHTLVKAMQERKIQRTYQSIVYGKTLPQGHIRTHMSRHPNQRTKMAVTETGKPAITHYKRLGFYEPFSHLEISLETGRTHQIRVHMAHIHCPIAGDPVYGVSGQKLAKYPAISEKRREFLAHFSRQALHAWRLCLTHPVTQETMCWTAPLPEDMQAFLDIIKEEI